MANSHFTSKSGLVDLQTLVIELEKKEPDSKVIKTLTGKYGIPYKTNVSEQLDELLLYLNSITVSTEGEPDQEL